MIAQLLVLIEGFLAAPHNYGKLTDIKSYMPIIAVFLMMIGMFMGMGEY